MVSFFKKYFQLAFCPPHFKHLVLYCCILKNIPFKNCTVWLCDNVVLDQSPLKQQQYKQVNPGCQQLWTVYIRILQEIIAHKADGWSVITVYT